MVSKLCVMRASTHFLSPPPPPLSLSSLSHFPLLRRFKPYFSSPPSAPPIKMSATSQIIEHIVLFKVKPDTDPSKIDSMVNNLNGLNSLDQVVHLTTGAVLRNKSSSYTFTHMLHSRYKSKEDLNSYSGHPSHVGVVTEWVRPICEDIMAVDWVAEDLNGPVAPPPGSAMRVTFLKLKDGLGESEKGRVLEVIGGIKESFPIIDQISYGENFSPVRAKGFSIASIAILPGLTELEAVDANSELANLEKDKVRDLLESVIVLDYVIPQQQQGAASL